MFGKRRGGARRQVWQSRKDELAALKEACSSLRMGDIPGGESLMHLLELHPEDSELSELLALTAQQQAARRAQVGPFWENYPSLGSLGRATPGTLPLIALPTGDVLSLSPREACQGVIVTGPPGSGKTTFLRNLLVTALRAGIPLVCFDSKNEKEDLLDSSELSCSHARVIDLDCRDLKIAVCEWPRGISREHGITRIVEEFAGNFSLQASRRLLLKTIHDSFSRYGSLSLPRLIEDIEGIPNKSPLGATARYKETVLAALEELSLSLGEAVSYSSSDLVDQVLSYRGLTLIRTAGLSDRVRSWLACRFIGWAFERRGIAGADCSVPIAFVLDDSLGVVRGDWREAEQGVSPVPEWTLLCRSRGMILVVGSHQFSFLSPVLRANTGTIVCCRAFGNDVEEVSRHFRLSSIEQRDSLARLAPGEAVVFSAKWPRSVWGKFPAIAPRSPGEDFPRQRGREFLARVVAEKFEDRRGWETQFESGGVGASGSDRAQHAEELSENARNVLIKVNAELCWLSKIYSDLNLGARRGGLAVRELIDKGLAIRRQFVKSGRGKNPEALELTQKGMEILARMGISARQKVLKGDWEHNFYGEVYLGGMACREGLSHKFEFTCRGELGAKTFDMVSWNSEGGMTGYEVVITGSAKANAERIRKGLRVEGISCVVVCCKDNAMVKALEREFNGEEKVRVVHLGEFCPK